MTSLGNSVDRTVGSLVPNRLDGEAIESGAKRAGKESAKIGIEAAQPGDIPTNLVALTAASAVATVAFGWRGAVITFALAVAYYIVR